MRVRSSIVLRSAPDFVLRSVLCSVVLGSVLSSSFFVLSSPAAPSISHAPAIARVYDTILNADFDAVPALLTQTCPPAGPEVCQMLEALALSWQIAIDPENRSRDARFTAAVNRAIASTEAWTQREPQRAEAWFYLGGAYGARVQFRVLRKERLAAARDGKRIKESLVRALALDPEMHDAKFGVGMYRYYADVAPAALRMLRWLLMLPGGDRKGGLQQMIDAADKGVIVRGEADYQLHLVYLWYEKRFREALTLVQGLQSRYPRNPHFYLLEAEIHDQYFNDTASSVAALKQVIALAESKRVNAPAIAIKRANALLTTITARRKR